MSNLDSVIIRADASPQIGSGHAMRCLALAQAIKYEGGSVTFVMRSDSQMISDRVQQEGCDIYLLQEDEDDREVLQSLKKNQNPKWIVVDGYQFDSMYQTMIKKMEYNLLFIDDFSHCDQYVADIVLNQNVCADSLQYSGAEQMLLGCDYVLLRDEFRSTTPSEAKQTGQNVLLSLGGFVPSDLAGAIKGELIQQDLNVEIATGSSDMPALMEWADCAVSAGGTTVYELAYMGVPAVLLVRADNQRAVAQGMQKAGCACNLGEVSLVQPGDILRHILDLMQNFDMRSHMSVVGRELVDGRGVFRVLDAIKSF
jgi:UDP-2,4-diacetamido-2,4,6-trideoxy-beta-L-altropyranose hydrolase